MVPAALMVIVCLAYFRQYSNFGLHGDDHFVFGSAALRDWSAEWVNAWSALTQWPQGRPLAVAVNLGVIPHLAYQLGGVPGFHVGAFCALSTSTILFYSLICRAYPATVSFAGAAFYALSPADCLQLSLVPAYNFEIAMAVALLAAHAALSRRPVLFLICLVMVLTMNEPAAMVPLVAPPLLSFHEGGARPARLVRHVGLWAAVVVAVLLTRRAIGDPWGPERVSEITGAPGQTLLRAASSAVVGFTTYIDLALERLLIPVRESNGRIRGTMASCGLVALGALVWTEWRWKRAGAIGATARRPHAVPLVAAGVLTMWAVYASYFRSPWYPAHWRTGFFSGVHVVSAAGAALLVAGLMHAALTWLPGRLRWAAPIAAAVVIGLLGGFGEILQRDYVASWRFQQDFWRAYRHLCRDATEGTFVLVPGRGLPQRRFIEDFSWGTEFLPGLLFRYHGVPQGSSTIKRAPVVIRTGPDPGAAIRREPTGFHWGPSDFFMLPKNDREQPQDGNVIVLERRGNRWHRIEGVLPVEGGALTLRPAFGDLLERIPVTPLARYYLP